MKLLKRIFTQIYVTVSKEEAIKHYRLVESREKQVKKLGEMLVDYFLYNNVYHSTDRQWQNYFYYFNYASRIK